MAATANPVLGEIENIFQTLIWEPLIKAALASLFVAAPWMTVWPLQPIITFALTQFSNLLFGIMSLTVDLGAIELVNSDAQTAYESASENLKIVALDKGLGSPEYAAALQTEKTALAKFVRFGASE